MEHSLNIPDSKIHLANMEPTWVLAAPGGPYVGPIDLAIRDCSQTSKQLPDTKEMFIDITMYYWGIIEFQCVIQLSWELFVNESMI